MFAVGSDRCVIWLCLGLYELSMLVCSWAPERYIVAVFVDLDCCDHALVKMMLVDDQRRNFVSYLFASFPSIVLPLSVDQITIVEDATHVIKSRNKKEEERISNTCL